METGAGRPTPEQGVPLIAACRSWTILLVLCAGCDGLGICNKTCDEYEFEETAWTIRWVLQHSEGVKIGCELYDLERESTDEAILGLADDVIPPFVQEPEVWVDEDAFQWALGLMLLVDAEADEEDIDGHIWGAAEEHAILFVGGDLEEAGSYLFGDSEAELNDDEMNLVEIFPEIAAEEGSFLDAMYPLPPDESDDLLEYGLTVTERGFLGDDAESVLLGDGLGPVYGCGEDVLTGEDR